MRLILICVFLVIVSLIGSLYFKLGGYKSVEVSEGDGGPFRIVYKHHTGAYHTTVTVIEEVEKWAKANGEPCQISFGEYLDDVDTVPEDRLQSNGGCIVAREWKSGLPDGFLYREEPRRHFVKAEFEGAPSIGPLKVYPKVRDYIAHEGLKQSSAVFELYEIQSEDAVKTTYLFSVGKK
jgi:hypothetical protein